MGQGQGQGDEDEGDEAGLKETEAEQMQGRADHHREEGHKAVVMLFHPVEPGEQVGAEAPLGPEGVARRGLPGFIFVDFGETVEVGQAGGPEVEDEEEGGDT